MPSIKVVNMAGAEVGSMELSNVLFGAEKINGSDFGALHINNLYIRHR